jgi:protein ImuA
VRLQRKISAWRLTDKNITRTSMAESTALLARLRRLAAGTGVLQAAGANPEAWLKRGLARAQLHEIYALQVEDGASGAGFGIAMAIAARALPLFWLRTEGAERAQGRLHAGGLAALGLDADSLVLGVLRDESMLLRAAADAARCAGLGTLLVETLGPAPGLDLTTTRRLMLAAEASGVTVLSLRVAATPSPSAAASRWGVRAAPSTALAAGAPGAPAFEVECLRRRGGPAGQCWQVEWDRDAKSFRGAPLSGAGLSVAADRAVAHHPVAPVRRSG